MDWGTLSGGKVLSYRRQRAQIRKIQAKLDRRLLQRSSNADDRVQQASRDPYVWVTRHAKTYNEHWHVEGRPSPYEPFPPESVRPDLLDAMAVLDSDERILWWEKSRDMMVSWACVAYLTNKAMTIPECGVVFQYQ